MSDNDSNCGSVPIQEVKPDLIEEEEEKVDEELQKEIKKAKIDESVFTRQDKKNGKEEKDEKKNQKKKGIDFMDYANQNNIQIKFQYEEDKYPNIRRDNEKNYQKNSKVKRLAPIRLRVVMSLWQNVLHIMSLVVKIMNMLMK